MKRILLVIGVPVLYAVILRIIFGLDTWRDFFTVMSITFLFCMPTIVGALTVYLSDINKVRKFSYRFFMPWVPVLVFFGLTIAFSLEGWACWIMVLPLFLVAASIGGLIGGYFRLRENDKNVYVKKMELNGKPLDRLYITYDDIMNGGKLVFYMSEKK